MPRKEYRARGPAAPNPGAAAPNPSPAAPNPSPSATTVAEVEGKLPHVGAFAVADALDHLHLGPASYGVERDLSEIEASALPHPLPVEASSSVTASSSWGPKEKGIRKLLELAKVGPEEVMLTQVEASRNDERQVDEICVLESIFEDSIDVLGRNFGHRSFQVSVSLDVSDALDVVASFNSGGGDLDKKSLDNKIRVQHLPPILLTCLLPASYPSHNPPLFTLAAQWLDEKRTSSLCAMLDNIWSDNVNDEVVYLWLDGLKNSSLSHLGFDNNEIVLSDAEFGKPGDTCIDQRACFAGTSLDVTIPVMIRHNEDKCNDDFLKNFHDCSICLESFTGDNFITLPCGHFFCLNCLESYCKMTVQEGKVMNLVCPDPKCRSALPPPILKKLLGKEYERFDELLLQRTLEGMADVTYCPRCKTPCVEDPGNEAWCSKCFYSFCTFCENQRHVGKQCISLEERLNILERREKSGGIHGKQSRTLDELRNIYKIKKDAKQCPKCRMAISKTEGCNKMACANCGQLFCYQCCAAISGYGHFSGSCVLFPQEDVYRWDRQMGQVAQDEMPAQITYLNCPTCDQQAAKIGGNNCLLCCVCNKNFCGECLKVVKDPTQHYGPNGCSLHS